MLPRRSRPPGWPDPAGLGLKRQGPSPQDSRNREAGDATLRDGLFRLRSQGPPNGSCRPVAYLLNPMSCVLIATSSLSCPGGNKRNTALPSRSNAQEQFDKAGHVTL